MVLYFVCALGTGRMMKKFDIVHKTFPELIVMFTTAVFLLSELQRENGQSHFCVTSYVLNIRGTVSIKPCFTAFNFCPNGGQT